MSLESVDDYLKGAFQKVQGWCIPHLWQAIQPLRTAMAAEGPEGPIGEIGVYHGKFFIGLVKTMDAAAGNTAIDVFDLQRFNLDGAGEGNIEIFQRNLTLAGVPTAAVDTVRADSMSLDRTSMLRIHERTGGFSMFSIDGCHLVEHTVNDLSIAMELTRPNGIIFVDDYYNANWPGVQEGVGRVFFAGAPRFVPLLFTCNKLFMCNISYHTEYLKLVAAFVRENHPTSRVKVVKRFGYETLTIVPVLTVEQFVIR